MRHRSVWAGAIGAIAMAGLIIVGSSPSGASGASVASTVTKGSSPTLLCTQLDPQLAMARPGMATFQRLSNEALTDGCVAYIDSTSTPSELELAFIRGAMTGTVIDIGPVETTSNGVTLTDVALAPSGILYGVDFGSDLYTINPENGQSTLVGPLNAVVNGLVVSATGTIYGSGSNDLVTVNPTTGASTLIGSTGYNSSGDLAFTPDGALYMTASGSSSDSLVTLNPTTGAGTLVGNINQGSVYGIVSSYGTLFGATSGGNLLVINSATGAATVVAADGELDANGMAVPPITAASTTKAGSTSRPTIAIVSTAIVPTGTPLTAPVSLACGRGAACAGVVQLDLPVTTNKVVGTKSVTHTGIEVIASAKYKLDTGARKTIRLPLSRVGRAIAVENSQLPVQATIVTSVKGGVYATRGVVVATSKPRLQTTTPTTLG